MSPRRAWRGFGRAGQRRACSCSCELSCLASSTIFIYIAELLIFPLSEYQYGSKALASKGLLTYMSLSDEIDKHVAAGRLCALPPVFRSDGPLREMMVSPDIFVNATPDNWPYGRIGKRLGNMRATFTNNKRISIVLFPKGKPQSTFMARIEPVVNEVWDIRCTDPREYVSSVDFIAKMRLSVSFGIFMRT